MLRRPDIFTCYRHVGALVTIGGGVLTLIVTAVTAYVQLGELKVQQRAMAEKMSVIGDRQGAITVSLARLESRLDVLMERRRAALGGPTTTASVGEP